MCIQKRSKTSEQLRQQHVYICTKQAPDHRRLRHNFCTTRVRLSYKTIKIQHLHQQQRRVVISSQKACFCVALRFYGLLIYDVQICVSCLRLIRWSLPT